jgi:hypothetical protein
MGQEIENVDINNEIISYNSIIDGVLGYHKRHERIAEFQEYKQLQIGIAKSKPVVIARHPIMKAKINADIGLLAFTTSTHEICVINTTTSEKLDNVQESQEKNGVLAPGQVFQNPAITWHQELLLVMDEVIWL